ncbi:hypothetical protein KIPB_007284 [Kipferlia bialata]|uniref:Uncharacterized protein n=1 Tax=Kipferlia bialata TaxID=797122 RepID=A0A9K3GKG7_9EUKA|nr:hypothetical protein KIPB_007284 [Kipferlia bialata]|eukprot:g7284.t1
MHSLDVTMEYEVMRDLDRITGDMMDPTSYSCVIATLARGGDVHYSSIPCPICVPTRHISATRIGNEVYIVCGGEVVHRRQFELTPEVSEPSIAETDHDTETSDSASGPPPSYLGCSMWVLSMDSRQWRQCPRTGVTGERLPWPEERSHFTTHAVTRFDSMTAMPDGQVLVLRGGWGSDGMALGDEWVYNPRTHG